MVLGKVDHRQISRIFFPGLFKPGESRGIPSETMTLVYEQCLRKAATAVNPFDQSQWPITYNAAMTLYRDQKGTLHFTSIDMPSNLLGAFGEKLLQLLDKYDGLAGAFFVHELRGTKGASHHDPYDEEARRAALDSVFHLFNRAAMIPEEWYIDIGLELRHKGHVLEWLTRGHRRLLKFLLPSTSQEKIDAILKSRGRYKCDLSAQLGDLGGFRLLPGSDGRADEVSYINVYTTGKSATYQLHEGIFKRRKSWHLFPGCLEKLVKDLERISEIFRLCGDIQATGGLESNARLEIRVPLYKSQAVLLQFPDKLIQDTVVEYDCATWW